MSDGKINHRIVNMSSNCDVKSCFASLLYIWSIRIALEIMWVNACEKKKLNQNCITKSYDAGLALSIYITQVYICLESKQHSTGSVTRYLFTVLTV